MKLSASDSNYFKTTGSKNIPEAAIEKLALRITGDDTWINERYKIVQSNFFGNEIMVGVVDVEENDMAFFKIAFETEWRVIFLNEVNFIDR